MDVITTLKVVGTILTVLASSMEAINKKMCIRDSNWTWS